MSNLARKHLDVVDAFARLTADVSSEQPSAEEAELLRKSVASALRTQLRHAPSVDALSPELRRAGLSLASVSREGLLQDLSALEGEPEDPNAAVLVTRSDERDLLSSRSLVNSLSGVLPSRRVGPLKTYGGIAVWFNVYLPAHRLEIVEAGETRPAIVLTSGRLPLFRSGALGVDIEPGTVWILGSLLDSALPVNAYVGFKVSGGSFKINGHTTTSADRLEVAAPLAGVLKMELAPDVVPEAATGCTGAGAAVTLPNTLTIKFNGGSSTVEGGSGTAQVWGQTFQMGAPTGTFTFIPRLWTLVIGYDVTPTNLDVTQVSNELVQFEGNGVASAAGLGVPVVVAPSSAILGAVAHSAEWYLQVKGLEARWYDSDARVHALEAAWVGISAFGVRVVADQVPALVPAVQHAYSLWATAAGAHRLPWRQSYAAPFLFMYGCHVVDGQYLLVTGEAAVSLDRPVTTDGSPLATPTKESLVLLRQLAGTIDCTLAASVTPSSEVHQFALKNALIWTASPALVYVRGELVFATRIDAGSALLSLSVTSWAPTLPDPYVSNGFIRYGARRGAAVGELQCRVVWAAPEAASVAFDGKIHGAPALGGNPQSPGDPRPARAQQSSDVGPKQTDQDRLHLDRKSEELRKDARAAELDARRSRRSLAQQLNTKSMAAIDALIAEASGSAPSLFLLDVSTNQDLLGVALGGVSRDVPGTSTGTSVDFDVAEMAVRAEVRAMRVVALPQVQWEPVRTLDADQDILTMGWFPTPLASATDGGATQIAARSQKLMPVIPEDTLQGTLDAFRDGLPVAIRTTFPFGLIAALQLRSQATPAQKADLYHLTRPEFPSKEARGGIQVTALAEGGRPDDGGISPMFGGLTRQLLNGVDLASGTALGLSVLGETLQPAGSVETIFNNDMLAHPRVPVTRVDISGYGGSNFSDWNNPFAAFAEAAKVQFRVVVGRTSLEVIKVNSVLHPWGIRVTRSITVERRSGGGVIRRDSGWQAITPGIFDYRYLDGGSIVVAPYRFDAGVFRGLFKVRNIRPAPGTPFSQGAATLVPYYFDADAAIEGVPARATALGVLGYLQTLPSGLPADADALRALIETQGPVGGPVETWMNFGASGLQFRVQRVEVGLAVDGSGPLFVATIRGVPRLPRTGAWSVVTRPASGAPPNGGEAVPVAESGGVPVIRRYPVRFLAGDAAVYPEPRRDVAAGPLGDYRFADAADLLTPSAPANDYALLQSTPTHAYLFPRPYVPAAGAPRILSGYKSALADVFARSTSKGAFPPPSNTIELAAGSLHFDVGASGKLALSAPVSVVGYATPLRLSGTPGHGTSLYYDSSTIALELGEDRWAAEFSGLQIWSDISGLERLTGSELRVVGSTEQRPQIAEIRSLLLAELEQILRYIPIFGERGVQGPVDLGATNGKHELKVQITLKFSVPPPTVIAAFPAGTGVVLTLFVDQSTGIDLATGGAKASATFGAKLDGKVPLLSVGVATVFLIVSGKVTFSLTSVSGSVTAEALDLLAFVGIGVEGKIGPFKAYAFLGVGFVLSYDAIADVTKYGGLVALEAGVDLTIVSVTIRAELKGLVYDDAGATKCDYSGSVKIEVDIFLIFSISASYQVTETVTI